MEIKIKSGGIEMYAGLFLGINLFSEHTLPGRLLIESLGYW